MHFRISVALTCGLIATGNSLKLQAATPAVPAPDDQGVEMNEMVVTTSRFDQTLFDQVQPASVLKDKELQYKLAPTLGETLNNEPGVSSTSFGPGASRPVIRGLGSDRVRILQNGTSVLDVSNVSPDHAVASDPSSLRSVEVVRGPATLLYGPNTLGGVVNMIDDRIAEEKFDGTWPTGSFETSAGTADDLLSASGSVKFGQGPFVFHLDGFHRDTDDLEIPGYARSSRLRKQDPLPPGETEARGTLPNSSTESKGAGLGGSYIWDKGYFGLSYSGMDSHYGTVAEEDVTIDLRQRRWDFRGAFYTPTPWLKEIDYKFGYSDYEHTEFEGSEVGTVFEIDGFNGRAEFKHEKIGDLEGVFGFETQRNKFSALGEEAFLPSVENNINSLFFFEELPVDKFRFQFGARYDHQSNDSQSNPNFGPGLDLDFDAFSASAGVVYTPVDDYAVALSVGYAQRPPTYVELFANGPHVATGAFEIGDTSLDTEGALSIDLSVRKKAGRVTGSAGVFYYHFNDYISLQPTGGVDPDEGLPIYAYQAIGADMFGGEAEAVFHLLNPVTEEQNDKDDHLDLILRADYVHAEDRDSDEPLPLMPPFRFTTALDYRKARFGARIEGQYAAAQDRNADFELPTDSYLLVNAGLSYDLIQDGPVSTTIFLKAMNLTDEEARYSTSILKDIAPVAGRGVMVGLRAEF